MTISANDDQNVAMLPTETAQDDLPSEAELRAWDWLADLRAQERSLSWLARKTDRNQQTVYLYSWGKQRASLEWLRSAARVLGKVGAS